MEGNLLKKPICGVKYCTTIRQGLYSDRNAFAVPTRQTEMPLMSLRFVQPCPTCGRRLEVRIELLGRGVACQHCRAEFVATDQQRFSEPPAMTDDLMQRVEAALRQSDFFSALD